VSTASADVIRWGRERVRTGPWHGDEHVAMITLAPETPLLSSEFVRHCLEALSARGFTRVITGALSPLEQAGFLAAGFGIHEHLRLLRIDLGPELDPLPPGPRLRRVPWWRRQAVLSVDRAAFADFWQFDEFGLADALRATPSVRFRAAIDEAGTVVGYAICGRSGPRGFVQRLAVHPSAQGRGIGGRLLLDGLHWLRARGATRAVVNTQTGNTAALSLYLKVGFREDPVGLSVLSTGLS
jgi:ribosomal protein S18 acetylase RimI-like enzyme